MRTYLFALIGIVFVSVSSCSTSGGGPIDGNYAMTTATCNGTQAFGSVISEAFGSYIPAFAPTVMSLGISGGAGAIAVTQGSCQISQPVYVSYPYNGAISIVPTSDSPSCNSACGGCPTTFGGGGTFSFGYNLSGSTLTLTAVSGDTTCSGGSPVQLDPVQYTFTTGTTTGIAEGGGGPATTSSLEADWGLLNVPGNLSIIGTISIPAGVPQGEIVQIEVYPTGNYSDSTVSSYDANGDQYTTGSGASVVTVTYEAYNLVAGNYVVCAELLNPSTYDSDYSGCYNGTSASPLQSLSSATIETLGSTNVSSISFGVASGALVLH